VAELASGLMRDFFERGESCSVWNLEVQAGHRLVGDAARVDELEVTKVGCDVESEAVGSDSA